MSKSSAHAPSVQDAIQATEAFFVPALIDRDSNAYITDKFVRLDDENVEDRNASRRMLLGRAGNLLHCVHSAVKFDQNSHAANQTYDSSLLLAVYKLLDFLLLEGVYPSLPPGIGSLQERRSKSLLYRNPDPQYTPLKGRDELSFVLHTLIEPLFQDADTGIEPMLRHRILTDLIAGSAWLEQSGSSSDFLHAFAAYIDKLPASTLFASYTALLRSSKPDRFRAIIAEHLALLPIRRNGVRNTIEFIAASYRTPQASAGDEGSLPSQGPPLPMEALQHASKLLSSVPRSMTAEQYFSKVAPQLLELLDDGKEVALQHAAAFIIGTGILGKKAFGAPGAVGWRLCVEPLMLVFNPKTNASRKRKANSQELVLDAILVPQQVLEQAIHRLSILVLSHPNPGLTGRLIRPLILPLWALSKYKGPSFASTELSKSAFALLARFFNLVGTPLNWTLLSDNISWIGSEDWVFGPGDKGGIAIRERDMPMSMSLESGLMQQVSHIDHSTQLFCSLLSSSKVNEMDLNVIFLHALNQQYAPRTRSTLLLSPADSSLNNLAQTKLVQTMMESYQESLIKSTVQVLDLVKQILLRHLEMLQAHSLPSKTDSRLTLADLTNVAQDTTERPQKFDIESQEDDRLMVALSLLNAFSASGESRANKEVIHKIGLLIKQLEAIQRILPANELLEIQIKTTIALLEVKTGTQDVVPVTQSVMTANAFQDVQQTLTLIVTDLGSEQPPIRRSALHAMQAIIKSADAPLDVPPLALLLLDLIRNENEEFIYLAAIQTTIQLALRRDLGFIARLFVTAFQDVEEETGLDGRLRTGECLAVLAQEIAEYNSNVRHGEAIRGMAANMIEVAARRGQRKREILGRQRDQRLQRQKKREAERAWGGVIPSVPDLSNDDNDEFEDLDPAQKQRRLEDLEEIEGIVQGWQDTGHEEDVRIRTSALSILGSFFESGGTYMTAKVTTDAMELMLSILTLELDASKGILRRAGTLCLFSILKAADQALQSGESTAVEILMNGALWMKAEKVLGWVKDTENDGIVKGHSETVLEGLEAMRFKVIAKVAGENQKPPEDRLQLEGKLKGLSFHPKVASSDEKISSQPGQRENPTPPRIKIEELD